MGSDTGEFSRVRHWSDTGEFWVKMDEVCLVPLSRSLNRIAAVTKPKTAPYLGDKNTNRN